MYISYMKLTELPIKQWRLDTLKHSVVFLLCIQFASIDVE